MKGKEKLGLAVKVVGPHVGIVVVVYHEIMTIHHNNNNKQIYVITYELDFTIIYFFIHAHII